MILGTRPTIGWIGYLLVGKSPVKLFIPFLLFGVLTLFLLERSNESITLQFMIPTPGASTVIILPHPIGSSIGPFEACAVEAATNLPLPEKAVASRDNKRPVYLYQWYSNVAPANTWVQRLKKLNRMKILYLNLVKTLNHGPLNGMLHSGGWGGRPDWAIWLASGGSLLWRAGGILLPLGVLITKPINTESFGSNNGLLIIKKNEVLPLALGAPPHHPLIKELLHRVKHLNSSSYSTYNSGSVMVSATSKLLTEAVLKACKVTSMDELPDSLECQSFITMDSDDSVHDTNMTKVSSAQEEDASFIWYTGDTNDFKDLGRAKSFFRRHTLFKYCPNIHAFLEHDSNNML